MYDHLNNSVYGFLYAAFPDSHARLTDTEEI